MSGAPVHEPRFGDFVFFAARELKAFDGWVLGRRDRLLDDGTLERRYVVAGSARRRSMVLLASLSWDVELKLWRTAELVG